MRRAKPLFWYTGGKAKLFTIYYPFFQGLHPEHCIDYFGGSGSMSLWFHQLYPDAKLYLNEKDQALYGLFRCIQEDYETLCDSMAFLQDINEDWVGCDRKKQLYYCIRDEYNADNVDCKDFPDDLEDIYNSPPLGIKGTPFEHACYFFLRKLSFSGLNVRNKTGEYTSAPGIRFPMQPVYDPERLEAFKAMLDHAELFNTDYRHLDIQRPKSLHYFDPPYVDSIQDLFTSRFGWDETEELCEYVQRVSAHSTVFMSNYDHPRLKKLLKGFAWYTFPAVGGMQRNKRKEPVREILFYKIHPSIASS